MASTPGLPPRYLVPYCPTPLLCAAQYCPMSLTCAARYQNHLPYCPTLLLFTVRSFAPPLLSYAMAHTFLRRCYALSGTDVGPGAPNRRMTRGTPEPASPRAEPLRSSTKARAGQSGPAACRERDGWRGSEPSCGIGVSTAECLGVSPGRTRVPLKPPQFDRATAVYFFSPLQRKASRDVRGPGTCAQVVLRVRGGLVAVGAHVPCNARQVERCPVPARDVLLPPPLYSCTAVLPPLLYCALHDCNAVSGTDLGCLLRGARMDCDNACDGGSDPRYWPVGSCYAVSGTDLGLSTHRHAYYIFKRVASEGGFAVEVRASYALAMQCPDFCDPYTAEKGVCTGTCEVGHEFYGLVRP
eukprot:263360-Rhodomonas_salina.5